LKILITCWASDHSHPSWAAGSADGSRAPDLLSSVSACVQSSNQSINQSIKSISEFQWQQVLPTAVEFQICRHPFQPMYNQVINQSINQSHNQINQGISMAAGSADGSRFQICQHPFQPVYNQSINQLHNEINQ
jgi:hypothetical protein